MDEPALDTFLIGPPPAPPLLPRLASAVHRMADAIEGPEHARALAWVLRDGPCWDALRVLRALCEACGQSATAEDAAAMGINMPGACAALVMVREAEGGSYSFVRHGVDAPPWYLRVDAYGLAAYGHARGWCRRSLVDSLRELARHADMREVVPTEIEPALEAVAERADVAATEHARIGIGRELWDTTEVDAATAAGWMKRWQ